MFLTKKDKDASLYELEILKDLDTSPAKTVEAFAREVYPEIDSMSKTEREQLMQEFYESLRISVVLN
jgi:hypothetical protein